MFKSYERLQTFGEYGLVFIPETRYFDKYGIEFLKC